MKVAPVDASGAAAKRAELTDEEIVASYEKARRMAEQNASVPPSVNASLFDAPETIPVEPDDAVAKARERKDRIDGERRDREARLLESMLRNREKIRKSAGA